MRTLTSLVFLVSLTGCLEGEIPARWHYLHAAIIEPACATAGCHSKLAATAGVNLATAEGAYAVLTGRICGEPSRPQEAPRNYVTPYSAASSQLIYQLRGHDEQGRPFRAIMPPDAPLPALEVDAIARWIDAGARCD